MTSALKAIGITDTPSAKRPPPGGENKLLQLNTELSADVDDYIRYKKLEKQMEHLDVMEEYIKLETRNLEKELLHAQEEVCPLL
jgi:hypothetical protein